MNSLPNKEVHVVSKMIELIYGLRKSLITYALRIVFGMCRDVTNSWLDDKLPLAGLWLFLVEVILSKERIQNYSFFLISRKMKPRKM